MKKSVIYMLFCLALTQLLQAEKSENNQSLSNLTQTCKMDIKFSHIVFFVSDVNFAVEFYKQAFGIKPRFIHESLSYAELDTGGVTLAFASEEIARMNLKEGFNLHSLKDKPQACEIAFTTADPQALYEKVQQLGATAVAPPEMKPWGQVVAYVRDPFGVLIEICSIM